MDLSQIFIRAKEKRRDNWRSQHRYLVTRGQDLSLPQSNASPGQKTPALLIAQSLKAYFRVGDLSSFPLLLFVIPCPPEGEGFFCSIPVTVLWTALLLRVFFSLSYLTQLASD